MQCYKYILKLIEQMLIRGTFTLINKFTYYLEVIGLGYFIECIQRRQTLMHLRYYIDGLVAQW